MSEEIKAVLKEELEDFKKNLPAFATPEDVENKINQIEEKFEGVASKDDIKELKDIAEKQGLEMAKMQEVKHSEKQLDELISEKHDEIKQVFKAKAGRVNIQIDKTDVTRASVTNHTLAMRLPDVGQLAFKSTKLEPIFAAGSVGPNSNGTIRYVDQASVTRNAAGVAEAAQKPESAITWQEYSLPIEVYADTIPVTMQAMEQVDFMATEINNFLLNNLRLKIDTDLYAGDGVTPNIFGAYTRADTFTPAASGISDANIYDLIVKVVEDITATTQYEPNYCVLPYALYSQLILHKDSQNNYLRFNQIFNPTLGQMGIMINGVFTFPSASATANTLVVGDFNYATLYNLGGISLDIGWIDKQFVENMMTVRAERQIGMLIRTAHTDAFRKVTDVAAALTTLAT